MYITNTDELVPALRARLPEYLEKMNILDGAHSKKFRCIVHNDSDPSMVLNPKTGYETAHCFSCGATVDIFNACHLLEGLPTLGPAWMTETVPHLATLLDIKMQLGEASPTDKEKAKLYRLAQDIADIITDTTMNDDYISTRGWNNDVDIIGSIDTDELMGKLVEKGWSSTDINTSLMLRTSKNDFFGEDKVTFVIKDFRGRPVGFISRNLNWSKEQRYPPKYINTTETLIYEKKKILYGLHDALVPAKHNGLYIVEGQGDKAQLSRVGIRNVAATCGTAFTSEHLNSIKMLGIRNIYFALDWDKAGLVGTQRIFQDVLKTSSGVSCWVVEAPEDSEAKDPGELLEGCTTGETFKDLKKTPAFEWVLRHISENEEPADICAQMIPIIALEPTAVRRELLIKTLVDYTGFSYQNISTDVNMLRNGKQEERRGRLTAAAEQYVQEVGSDPDNMMAIMAQHEQTIRWIEGDYEKDIIGVNYQLNRYLAIQEIHKQETDNDSATFKMSYFTGLSQALSGGMLWTSGCLVYVGGRANSGKTAVCVFIGLDIAMSDPDAIVLMHFTDDSYRQIEPRLKTNISDMLHQDPDGLTIGMAASPRFNIHKPEHWAMYNEADHKLQELIANEKLVIIDSEDGPTLSTLEKNLRYLRQRHPTKKILLVCDNTHNYMDFLHMDQSTRMTMISTQQKNLTTRYHCCMVATAEYRKNMPMDRSKMKLPVDDDLADARALMYRPNVIFHVYNDLNDRQDFAEIFHSLPNDPDVPLPRLMLIFSKNKITSFKDKLVVDLHPSTVTLRQQDKKEAYAEFESFSKSDGSAIVAGRVQLAADEYN